MSAETATSGDGAEGRDGDECQIVRSNKGRPKLVHRGYIYTVHKQRLGMVRWRCIRRNIFCKGSMTTTSLNPNTKVRTISAHNHVPDPHAVDAVLKDGQLMSAPKEKRWKWHNLPTSQIDRLAHLGTALIPDTGDAANPQQCQAPAAPATGEEPRPKIKISQVRSGNDDEDEEVCLKWNSHHSNMQATFPFLLAKEQFVDVTLCAEGQSIRCHKLVLSACSTYFDDIISGLAPWQHPVIFLTFPFWVIKSLIDFMYVGEISVENSKVQTIMSAGNELKIKGLTTASGPQAERAFSPSGVDRSAPILSPAASPKAAPQERHARPSFDDAVKMLQSSFTNPADGKAAQGGAKQGKVKRGPKRRIDEPEPPETSELPEHLLFVRKGTRSRPLVKTPKIYQVSWTSPKEKEREAKDARDAREWKDRKPLQMSQAPSALQPPPPVPKNAIPPKKQVSLLKKSLDTPPDTPAELDFDLVRVKQEPLDITETDFVYDTFQNDGHVLLFDEEEDKVSGDVVDHEDGQDAEEFMEVLTSSVDRRIDAAEDPEHREGLDEEGADGAEDECIDVADV